MTTRHAAYIVILRDDIREDEAGPTLNALRMIHNVARVEPLESDWNQQIAITRRDNTWKNALLALATKGPSS